MSLIFLTLDEPFTHRKNNKSVPHVSLQIEWYCVGANNNFGLKLAYVVNAKLRKN